MVLFNRRNDIIHTNSSVSCIILSNKICINSLHITHFNSNNSKGIQIQIIIEYIKMYYFITVVWYLKSQSDIAVCLKYQYIAHTYFIALFTCCLLQRIFMIQWVNASMN